MLENLESAWDNWQKELDKINKAAGVSTQEFADAASKAMD